MWQEGSRCWPDGSQVRGIGRLAAMIIRNPYPVVAQLAYTETAQGGPILPEVGREGAGAQYARRGPTEIRRLVQLWLRQGPEGQNLQRVGRSAPVSRRRHHRRVSAGSYRDRSS